MYINEIIRQGRVILMDGDTSALLASRVAELQNPQQLHQAVLSCPQAVEEAHTSFIQAGAEIILTHTSHAGLDTLTISDSAELFAPLNTQAVVLARQARYRNAAHTVAVAGHLCPPADNDQSCAHMVSQAELLMQAGVNLLMLECTSVADAESLLPHLVPLQIPVWAGFELETDTAGREQDIVRINHMISTSLVQGVGLVNTPSDHIRDALRAICRTWDGPVYVRPQLSDPDQFASCALDMFIAGANAVGATTPAQLQTLHNLIKPT